MKISGLPFSFIERIKMRGIGCTKLQIIESSPQVSQLVSANTDTAYCNIELRKTGIVVGFNSVMRIYAWCIPYHQLNMYYNAGQLSIYGPYHNIKAIAPFNGTVDKKFIKKVLTLKAAVQGNPLY